MRFTKKMADANEKKVLELFNDNFGEFVFAENNYSVYDMKGTLKDGRKCLVEIKKRRPNDWATWFIEEEKMLRIGEIADSYDEEIVCLLVVSTDEHQIYDMNDIANYPVISRWMNKQTVSGWSRSGDKVEKKVYEFPKTVELNRDDLR